MAWTNRYIPPQLRPAKIEFEEHKRFDTLETEIVARATIEGREYGAAQRFSYETMRNSIGVREYAERAMKDMILNEHSIWVTTTASASTSATLSVGTTTSTSATEINYDAVVNMQDMITTATSIPPEFFGSSFVETTAGYQYTYNRLYGQQARAIIVDDFEGGFTSRMMFVSETEEEKFIREWNGLLYQKRRANEKLYKGAAESRSLELLVRNLSETQLRRFEEDKCIPVDGPSGKKYLIKPARSINIEVVGKHHRLCAGIADSRVPLYDAMLAQKLLLESDERRFLKVAITHR